MNPDALFFFLDSRHAETSTAKDHAPIDANAGKVLRKLTDGREFEIVKVFHSADRLREIMAAAGLRATVHQTDNYFLYGVATRC